MNAWELDRLLKHAPDKMKKDYISNDFRMGMIDDIVGFAQSELIAYLGMILILTAFFLETRDVLHSKAVPYLGFDGIRLGIASYSCLFY